MFIRADNKGLLNEMWCYYAFKDINIQCMFLFICVAIKTAKSERKKSLDYGII